MRALAAAAALAALTVLVAFPPAGAHGEYEASELEVHLLSDEGSDVIESYGGYDIQDLFIGFAHDPAVGAGAAGDGFYLRAEIYGLPENAAQPPDQEWTVTFFIGTPGGEVVRSLSSSDGATFTSDFDSLLYEVDVPERSTHVQRAFLSFASAGVAPGQPLGPFRVESTAGGDLRDVAPGGIPVPGTGGLAEYPDPTQIDGEGELVTSLPAKGPDGYVAMAAVADAPGDYTVTVASLLKEGGQHVIVTPRTADGWELTLGGETNKAVDANGTATFTLHAVAAPGAAPLELDVTTDIGGRSTLLLQPDGTLVLPDGTQVAPVVQPAAESPAPAVALLAGLLAAAAILRRR